MSCSTAPIIALCDGIVSLLNGINWIEGLTASRTYQRDVELKELQKLCIVYPANETFARASRAQIQPDLVVGVCIMHRPATTANDDVDPWANEVIAIRDLISENDAIGGYDLFGWEYAEGEMFDSEYLRKSVFASPLELVYRRRR